MSLRNELHNACDVFMADFPPEVAATTSALQAESQRIQLAYIMAASVQAWKTEFLEKHCSEGSLGFFVEAQNDLLLSLVLAVQGLCRPSLQSLRSVIENVYAAVYYADHPIELELWTLGKHRLDRKEYSSYFAAHPRIRNKTTTDCGLQSLDKQYGVLNNAVHGSRAEFRMTTNPPNVNLTIDSVPRFRQWHLSYTQVARGTNMLLLALFGSHLSGAAYLGLKRTIYLSLTSVQRNVAKAAHGVSLPVPR